MNDTTFKRVKQQLAELDIRIKDFEKQDLFYDNGWSINGRVNAALDRKLLEVSMLLTDLRLGR